MHPRYQIIAAQPEHIQSLPALERAAATLLVDYAPAAALADTTPIAEFSAAQHDRRLWVALDAGAPVGFALAVMLAPRAPHLQEMDVSPTYMRQGIGTALVTMVLAWSRREAWAPLTLTTFRDAPWNAPFYARLGFAVLAPDAWSPALRSLVDGEHARGLDRARRVVMEYRRPVE